MPRFYSLYRMKSLCCTASSHGPFVRSVRQLDSASFLTRYYRGVGQVFPQQLQLHLLVHHLILRPYTYHHYTTTTSLILWSSGIEVTEKSHMPAEF